MAHDDSLPHLELTPMCSVLASGITEQNQMAPPIQVDENGFVRLSDKDIEKVAQRVIELIRGKK